MLYIYEAYEGIKSDEEIETIKGCKELKSWDEYCYIGEVKSFVANEMEIVSERPFSEFVDFYFRECTGICSNDKYISIRIPSADIEYSNEYALECLVEDLGMETSDFADRIFNANNPFVEAEVILTEIMINFLNSSIMGLQNDIAKIRNGEIN